MIYTIKIMIDAENDIQEICNFSETEYQNSAAAERRFLLIDKAIQSLQSNPERHALVRDDYLASKGFRLLVVKTHVLFYTVHENHPITNKPTVSIMRVLHGRRDWANLLKADIENSPDDD